LIIKIIKDQYQSLRN